MCCHWVESERPKAIIPCFNGILILLYSSQHKNTVRFGGKLDDGLFGSYKGSKNEFIHHSLFNTGWNMHFLRIRQLSGHTQTNCHSEKGHLPDSMSNEVKQWDYRYQERKQEAPEERHICEEPQC